jgi:hypothetical protein
LDPFVVFIDVNVDVVIMLHNNNNKVNLQNSFKPFKVKGTKVFSREAAYAL